MHSPTERYLPLCIAAILCPNDSPEIGEGFVVVFPKSLQADAVDYLKLATAVSFHSFPQSDSVRWSGTVRSLMCVREHR